MSGVHALDNPPFAAMHTSNHIAGICIMLSTVLAINNSYLDCLPRSWRSRPLSAGKRHPSSTCRAWSRRCWSSCRSSRAWIP